jgi:hypothetical protein
VCGSCERDEGGWGVLCKRVLKGGFVQENFEGGGGMCERDHIGGRGGARAV